ncbi:hypothetical protein FB561_2561 [Kribbella amoyensis]|uniref:Uncharacterized protein n=1 Tax=Kribbella amoyensis TaxID=996641 RepID=A0A561BRD4_9ACTN|nr:hypothetical protein [Kribbella amoyensis]TWD81445.1 hypothetical protein FB561_2561 [Kribbella amoyensis]
MQVSPNVRRAAVAAGLGLGTVGLLAGVLLFGPLAATLLLLVVFALTWPLAAIVKHLADDTPFQSSVGVALVTAAGMLCVPGLIRLLASGALGISLALLFAVVFVVIDRVLPSDRPERRRSRRRSRSKRRAEQSADERLILMSRPQDEVDDEALIASLQCPLSIEELCGVWCETTQTLEQGADLRDRQAVAEVRRICLDEFERRNPEGFQRWIGAGASGDPGTFLLPEPGE